MSRVVATKTFNKCLRDLTRKGKKGKDAMVKAQAAQAQAATQGEISLVQHTKHGETRLPNVEKYDLGDGYRLVVQLVDPAAKQRAFLFVGDHEDAETWLDNHKNYRWVMRDDDATLEFVQVSDESDTTVVVPKVDVDSPDSLLDLPLLRDIKDKQWSSTRLSTDAVLYLKNVSGSTWEQDPTGIIEHLESLDGTDNALLALDLLTHAHSREWAELHRRLELESGQSKVVEDDRAGAAMVAPINSEQFVTWEEISSLPPGADWAEWMLFLHPEQKDLAHREFSGAARLRGVSGSGKTCVMIHRARFLARKYRQGILLVTLTESTRRLLDLLVKLLCGAEGAHIKTSTMNSIATDAIDALSSDGLRSFTLARTQIEDAKPAAFRAVRDHPSFRETVLSKLPENKFEDFITDEVAFVRMRFLPGEYERYRTVPRPGRDLPLPEKARLVILAGVEAWDRLLERYYVKDHEGIVQTALSLLTASSIIARRSFHYRSVLVDEVQDLSQLELRLLSRIPDQDGKPVAELSNGLFLVGDGAQTIYKRGFSLKQCGIGLGNRSYVLKKNYRNTREILEAAYGLIEKYEFADVDEENIQKPTAPDLSSRHGERPLIVKCSSYDDECDFVVGRIREILEEQRLRDETAEVEVATEIPICVIGFTKADRGGMERALQLAGIPSSELREDVAWEGNAVKISTLESAKGHEFHAVFIVGLRQGNMPSNRVDESDWKREAARLYVAMTRARDRLYLTYDIWGNNNPSVFLSAIQSNCQECQFKHGRLAFER